jgi:gliding motility-associated-like protein
MNYTLTGTLIGLTLAVSWLSGKGDSLLPMAEVCDNARDDDGDGLIDLNDPDCDCPTIEPVSLIPNPSFEDNECCPSSRSQLYCADTWIQASEATTDYLHTCGWMGWENLPPPPLPFPDGEAVVGFRNGRFSMDMMGPNWKEYAGACLLAPLRANTSYRIQFDIGFINSIHSPPLEVVLFGTPDCANLPFGLGDPDFGCPTNGPGWIRLGSVHVNGSNNWVTTAINTAPRQDIYAVAIGPNCRKESATTDLYYFLDNLVLDKQEAFDFRISARNHPCSEAFTLEAPESDTLTYQWYKDGVALVGVTGSSLPVSTGEGRYQLRVSSPAGCKVLRPYNHRVPSFTNELEPYICAGEAYAFDGRSITTPGTYEASFKTEDNCDSLVRVILDVVDPVYDTLHARIFEGEEFQLGKATYYRPGQYRGHFSSAIGCDSMVTLYLDYYQVYFPTAFSPNGDGINDAFSIFGGPDLQRVASLEVFDRWGGLQFSGEDLPPNDTAAGWNGKRKGEAAPPAVYVYTARLLMDDGKEHLRYGSVLLMR